MRWGEKTAQASSPCSSGIQHKVSRSRGSPCPSQTVTCRPMEEEEQGSWDTVNQVLTPSKSIQSASSVGSLSLLNKQLLCSCLHARVFFSLCSALVGFPVWDAAGGWGKARVFWGPGVTAVLCALFSMPPLLLRLIPATANVKIDARRFLPFLPNLPFGSRAAWLTILLDSQWRRVGGERSLCAGKGFTETVWRQFGCAD